MMRSGHDDRRPGRQADRRRAQRIARRLEQDVPRDVQDRRAGDQREDKRIHGPMLAGAPGGYRAVAALAPPRRYLK